MLNSMSIFMFMVFLTLMGIFSFIDLKKKRKITKKYFISFLVPCYNDSETIKDTIESIYDSYEKENFELFVINDNSKDNSLEIIKNLAKKYKFNVINNKENLGKSKSINNTFEKTKGGIIFVVDADTKITKKGVEDIISRFNYNKKIGAVSCSCKAKGKGFFAIMQAIEYNLESFIWYSHNIYSVNCLWGPCIAVKRKAFENVKRFSENALSEDADLALKLNKNNWKVEQSRFRAETKVPDDFRNWFKQKIRWNSGGIQCLMTYPDVFIKNPVTMCIAAIYGVIIFLILINTLNIAYFYYSLAKTLFYLIHYAGFGIFNTLLYLDHNLKRELLTIAIYQTSFLIFNIPYTISLIKKFKDVNKILLVIPFSLIYGPLFFLTFITGAIKGIKFFYSSRNRAW